MAEQLDGEEVVTPLPLWTALAGAALGLGIAALEAEDLRALGPLEDHPTRTLSPRPNSPARRRDHGEFGEGSPANPSPALAAANWRGGEFVPRLSPRAVAETAGGRGSKEEILDGDAAGEREKSGLGGLGFFSSLFLGSAWEGGCSLCVLMGLRKKKSYEKRARRTRL